MLGIGFWELLVVAGVALVVYQPRDIVKIMFFLGQQFRKFGMVIDNLKEQYNNYIVTEVHNNKTHE